jgi:hypothetical protein
MHRTSLPSLGLIAGTLAAFLGVAMAVPAQAAGGWSATVPLPISGGSIAAAVNAAGEAAAINSGQTASGTAAVSVSTSANGQTWTTPVTLGPGGEPAVPLAPSGRTVAVWQGFSGIASTGVQASVLAPGGTWSAPVTVAPAGINPQVAVDAAGDAVALWTTSGSSAASVQAAILRAGGTWSAPVTLGKSGTPNLAVNTAGAILAGWTASPHETTVSAGTVSGGWSAPVTLGPATAYKQAGVHLALAANGQGVALWTGGNGVQTTTLSPGGTWTAPVIIASSTSTVASGLAADATGDAVALLTENVDIGSTITWVPETARHSLGGGRAQRHAPLRAVPRRGRRHQARPPCQVRVHRRRRRLRVRNSLHAVESLARAKLAEEDPAMVAAAVAYGTARLQTGEFPQLSAIAAASAKAAEPPGPPMTEAALTSQFERGLQALLDGLAAHMNIR